MRQTAMLAQLRAIGVQNRPRRRHLRRAINHELGVIAVLDKADFLRIGLVRHAHSEFSGALAHDRLFHRTNRQQNALQFGLRQHSQNIRLIFANVQTAPQMGRSIGVAFQTRVMSGRDELAIQLVGALDKRAKLDELVAARARIGRAPRCIFGHEIIDDALVKFVLQIQNVIGNIELMRHAPRVFGRANGAAAAETMRGKRIIFSRPQLHGDADHFIILLDQKRRRHARIDAATHRH